MSLFDVLAEQRIKHALENGELSGLSGEGFPLEFDDDCLVPPDVRMSNKILRNAGCVPPAVGDLLELRRIVAAVMGAAVPSEATTHLHKMTQLLMRIEAAGLSHVSAVLLNRLIGSDLPAHVTEAERVALK